VVGEVSPRDVGVVDDTVVVVGLVVVVCTDVLRDVVGCVDVVCCVVTVLEVVALVESALEVVGATVVEVCVSVDVVVALVGVDSPTEVGVVGGNEVVAGFVVVVVWRGEVEVVSDGVEDVSCVVVVFDVDAVVVFSGEVVGATLVGVVVSGLVVVEVAADDSPTDVGDVVDTVGVAGLVVVVCSGVVGVVAVENCVVADVAVVAPEEMTLEVVSATVVDVAGCVEVVGALVGVDSPDDVVVVGGSVVVSGLVVVVGVSVVVGRGELDVGLGVAADVSCVVVVSAVVVFCGEVAGATLVSVVVSEDVIV
jgi:hypothetical protein